MNVRRHFKLRYLQRIEGLTDAQEIKRAMATRDDYLTESALKLFQYSKFLWRGQLGDNITRNYYINGDVILVTDADNTCLITVYKADFGFPPDTNRRVIRDLVAQISTLRESLETAQANIKEQSSVYEAQIEQIDAHIRELEARIDLLKQEKRAVEEARSALLKETVPLLREIDRYAMMLCNTLQYRNDLCELKKAN